MRAGEGFCVPERSGRRRDAGASWQDRAASGAQKTRQTDPQHFSGGLLDLGMVREQRERMAPAMIVALK